MAECYTGGYVSRRTDDRTPRGREILRSRDNARLKRVGAVRAGKERDTLLLEGERLVADALEAGVAMELVLVAADRPDLLARFDERAHVDLVEPELLARTSALTTSPGVLALAPAPPTRRLDELSLEHDALVLVAAGISDPGNLGALARSAEAAGAALLIVLRDSARPFGEKALRGSMGSLLRLPVVQEVSPQEVAGWLASRAARSVVAATRGGTPCSEFDWGGPVALWIGAETGELPEPCAAFDQVSIPMAGQVESLNLAVAASVLLFSAAQARGAGEAS